MHPLPSAGTLKNEALVPFLWTYEVANGLVMAQRRKRLAESDIATILDSLKALSIPVDPPDADGVLQLTRLTWKWRFA